MEMLRSPSGHEDDFRPQPYKIPKIPISDAKKNYYKQFLYSNIAHCSNIPTYEQIENGPWPKQKYVLERCVATCKGIPEILPEGTYKFIFKYTGEVEIGMTLIVKLKSKFLP